MTGPVIRSDAAAPVTYQQWLECLERLREASPSRSGVCGIMTRGTFCGSPVALAALEQQMADAIRTSLTRSTRRFLRELESSLDFHDLVQLELLFKRFRADILETLFFRELSFLPQEYRNQLHSSIVTEMSGIWSRTIRLLRQQTAEHSDPDLEDALFLIGRIRLFPK